MPRWIPLVLLAWAALVSLYIAVPQHPLYWAVPRALAYHLFAGGLEWGWWGNPHLALGAVLLSAAFCVLLGHICFAHLKLSGVPWSAWPGLALVAGLAVLVVPLELLAIGHLLHPMLILFLLVLIPSVLVAPIRRQSCCCIQPPIWHITPAPTGVRWTIWAGIALFSLLSLFHALLFPVTYWDALIYYVHYARLTCAEKGFPVIVQSQVGLGLGANYPHLFILAQAVPALLFNWWTTGYGQVWPPLCGVLSTLLIYRLCAERSCSETVGLLAALLYRAVPYGFFFTVYASDYAFALLLTTAFLFALHRAEYEQSIGYLAVCGAVCALAPHLNYLMWSLWPPFLLLVAVRVRCPSLRRFRAFPATGISWRVAGMLVAGAFLLASTWYVRNWVVTGNPVYPFFSQLFGGKQINRDVLASCEEEWMRNGDGIGAFVRSSGRPDTLSRRVLYALPYYLLNAGGYDRDGNFNPGTAYKLGALPFGFGLPGLLLLAWRAIRSPESRWATTGMLLFFGTVLVYQYGLAGMYLYHELIGLPILVVAAAEVLRHARYATRGGRFGLVAGCGAVAFTVLCPGLGCAVMGPKFHDPYLPQWPLAGQHPAVTLPLVYGEDVRMWVYLNRELAPAKPLILTHENRHLYLDPEIRLIHLDDAALWNLYGKDFEGEVLPRLLALGVTHYLRVPNERQHPILAQLGHGTYFRENGKGHLIVRFGENELYALPTGPRLPGATSSLLLPLGVESAMVNERYCELGDLAGSLNARPRVRARGRSKGSHLGHSTLLPPSERLSVP